MTERIRAEHLGHDLSIADDRLLAGIKGTVSEHELTLSPQRAAGASEAKDNRGEWQRSLPVGLCWSKRSIALSPDQRTQQAIRMIFEKAELRVEAVTATANDAEESSDD